MKPFRTSSILVNSSFSMYKFLYHVEFQNDLFFVVSFFISSSQCFSRITTSIFLVSIYLSHFLVLFFKDLNVGFIDKLHELILLQRQFLVLLENCTKAVKSDLAVPFIEFFKGVFLHFQNQAL